MTWLSLPQDVQAYYALAIVLGMFVLFVTEAYPTEVVAMTGAATLLALGILPYDDALAVLSNPAPWTIGAMFLLMGGLIRTGALNAFTRFAEARARSRPRVAVALLIGAVVLASGFVANTPVVVVMIPVMVQLSATLGVVPSKMLIPLSYASIVGGMLTLIGTSTNLLVDGVARAEGLAPFTIFEVTPLAAIICVWGLLYLWLIAPRLLPERTSVGAMLAGGDKSKAKFFAEIVIPDGSDLIGSKVSEEQTFKRPGVRLLDVVRGDRSLRRELDEVVLRRGDRVVLRTEVAELLTIQRDADLKPLDQIGAVETTTVEVLVTPGARLVGRTLGVLRLRRRYGVYPLAIHRRDKNLSGKIEATELRVGDTLLIEGAEDDIHRFAQDMRLQEVSHPIAMAFRRERWWIPVLVIALLVTLAAIGAAPILPLAVLGVVVVLVSRCVDAEEAFELVEGRLLVMIFSMLAVGAGLQASGAVAMIVDVVAPHISGLPAPLLIWSIFLMTSILTEMVSNNAVAVVVTPIVIALGGALGVDPRPLVVTVMVAASASFSTPIGYQTNTLVYGPGGYRFTDFMRAGIPLNLSVGAISAFMIPLIWPL
ncbi:SLC13 family permease [Jannaschia sp. LMIT008]|uniref:SLC13 family permease n=1 Tax=Jannaschia maritima TaxID=3032585 RepID=UPI002811685E|nr:SLC13 family permease [Jannaschia sp. LMIT008]